MQERNLFSQSKGEEITTDLILLVTGDCVLEGVENSLCWHFNLPRVRPKLSYVYNYLTIIRRPITKFMWLNNPRDESGKKCGVLFASVISP